MALRQARIRLLPNTSSTKTADEALFAAGLVCEALGIYWIKLEIHPDMQYLLSDPQYLLSDPIETLKAAEKLVKEGVCSIALFAVSIRCFTVS